MEIHILSAQGHGIRAIAAQLGVSRNTVRRALREAPDRSYGPRAVRAGKLDAHKDYLRERMAAAAPVRLPAPVLLRELRERGYDGQVSILKDFLRTLRPAAVEAPLLRYETAPGEQMQVDWAVFRRGPAALRLSAFVATLGYSRAAYVEFVADERLQTLLECQRRAFEYFGGVPARLLYDNMKTVVLERDAYGAGQHRFQPALWDFARHHGFLPRLCRPYRAQTKGKVERFIHYLRYSFFHPLASRLAPLLVDVAMANREVGRWLDAIANRRVHAGTGAIPQQRLDEERPHLRPLPPPWRAQLPAAVAPAVVTVAPARPQAPAQHPLAVYDAFSHVGSAAP